MARDLTRHQLCHSWGVAWEGAAGGTSEQGRDMGFKGRGQQAAHQRRGVTCGYQGRGQHVAHDLTCHLLCQSRGAAWGHLDLNNCIRAGVWHGARRREGSGL